MGGGGGEEETLLMTATQAAWMASLVGFGFVVLVVSFVVFAAAPAGTHPGTLEAIKCVVLVVVIGCVVVTDALPWVSKTENNPNSSSPPSLSWLFTTADGVVPRGASGGAGGGDGASRRHAGDVRGSTFVCQKRSAEVVLIMAGGSLVSWVSADELLATALHDASVAGGTSRTGSSVSCCRAWLYSVGFQSLRGYV